MYNLFMREVFKPSTDERPSMIIMGIISLFVLVFGFIIYLYFLHRISLIVTIISILIFVLIYFPRFLIIKKLLNKDDIKISDNSININGQEIEFSNIVDFKVEEKKPSVIFVFSNNLIVYKEAKFRLRLNNGEKTFVAIGSEKITLLKEFLGEIIS